MAGDRQKPYIGQGALDLFRVVLAIAGVALAIAAVLYAINGMTQAPAAVSVPVALADAGLTWSGEAAVPVPGLPVGSRVYAPADAVMLAAWESTRLEWFLSRGETLLLGLGLCAAAFLLLPVLTSISLGRPFVEGNARRLRLLALLVLLVGYVAPLLPQTATLLVLDRLGIGPDGPFVRSLTFSFLPLVLAALVLVTAEAFRRGESISADVEGLV